MSIIWVKNVAIAADNIRADKLFHSVSAPCVLLQDALRPDEMNPAEAHCEKADVVLCLGTSLQITPACNLPLKCLRGGGKVVIVNLQKTPKDKKASLVIHGFVDKVLYEEQAQNPFF